MDKSFQYEKDHKRSMADIFGMTGSNTVWITLHLRMRAYLLLREEHPLSIPCCEKMEDGLYQFHGPVNNFDGIARFVLVLLDEVRVVQPDAFREYVLRKIRGAVSSY
jgi:predicted DNA-binding transcriptional regulator YafY